MHMQLACLARTALDPFCVHMHSTWIVVCINVLDLDNLNPKWESVLDPLDVTRQHVVSEQLHSGYDSDYFSGHVLPQCPHYRYSHS